MPFSPCLPWVKLNCIAKWETIFLAFTRTIQNILGNFFIQAEEKRSWICNKDHFFDENHVRTNYMSKIAKVDYYTTIKNASSSADECVLAVVLVLQPWQRQTMRHPNWQQRKADKPLPKAPSSPIWKAKHRTTHRPSSSAGHAPIWYSHIFIQIKFLVLSMQR